MNTLILENAQFFNVRPDGT